MLAFSLSLGDVLYHPPTLYTIRGDTFSRGQKCKHRGWYTITASSTVQSATMQCDSDILVATYPVPSSKPIQVPLNQLLTADYITPL